MKRRQRLGREAWVRIIGEQKRSGLSAAAYCRQEDIGITSFSQWKRRLAGVRGGEAKPSRDSFIDMGRVGLTGNSDEKTEVRRGSLEVTLDLGDGARLILRRG